MQNGQLLVGSGEDMMHKLDEVDVSRNRSRNIIPRFFMGLQKKPDTEDGEGEVLESGGFREVEYVELLIPGDKNAAPVQLVDKNLRKMYAESYKAFKEGRELPENGTPVEFWLGGNDHRVHMLKSLHFRTVESVAEMSDAAMAQVGMGARELRKRAIAFLDTQSNTRVADKLAAKDNELDELKKRLAALEAGGPVSSIADKSKVSDDDEEPVPQRPTGASPVSSDKAPKRRRG